MDTKNLFKLLLNHLFTVKDETTKKIKRFKPNKSQIRILKTVAKRLKKGQKSKLIIIKGRQVGGSSLIQRMQLDCALSIPNFNCYVQAHDQQSASRMFLENVKNVFDRMEFYKDFYTASLDNVNQLYLKHFNGSLWNSEIRVGTSARSSQVDFLHISEAGKIGNQEIKWRELVNGTLQAGEQSTITIIETTAEGENLFYDWVMAQKENPDWEILFLSWTDKELYQKTPPKNNDWKAKYFELAEDFDLVRDPVGKHNLTEAQFYWYYLKARELGMSIKGEYPLTIEEAFSNNVKLARKFGLTQIHNLRQKALPIKNTKEFTVCPNTASAKIAKVKFYHNLLTNQYYVLSIDFSSGVGQDYTTIQLRTQDNKGVFRQVATVRDKLTINQTSDLALQLADFINSFSNQTILTPEINTPHDVPITYWKEHGYNMDLVYQEIDPDLKQIQDKNLTQYGFRTTAQNRNAIIDKYKLLLDKDLIEVNDLEELKEMEVFVLNDKGKFEALPSHHDDLLLADFINIQGFEFLRRSF